MTKPEKLESTHLFVIGAQKSATTWIQHLFDWHKDYFWVPSLLQEIHFFDREYEKKHVDKYVNLYSNAPGNKITCDVTPDYLSEPNVAERIHEASKEMNRNFKFILSCREPVSRLKSAFVMKKRKGKDISLNAALDKNSDLFQKGRYFTHLQRWLKYFDKEQFFIFILDDLKEQKSSLLEDLSSFLDISGCLKDPYQGRRVNPGGLRKLRFVNKILSLGGDVLRIFGLNRLLHMIKRSRLAQSVYGVNRKEYKFTSEENEVLKELKEIYRPEVYNMSDFLNRPDIPEKWNY